MWKPGSKEDISVVKHLRGVPTSAPANNGTENGAQLILFEGQSSHFYEVYYCVSNRDFRRGKKDRHVIITCENQSVV